MLHESSPYVTCRRFITLTGSALAGTMLATAVPPMAAAGQKTCGQNAKKGGTLRVAIIGEPLALGEIRRLRGPSQWPVGQACGLSRRD